VNHNEISNGSVAYRLTITVFSVLILTILALTPAFWNGFPILFDDSGFYFGVYNYPGWSPFYTAFVELSSFGQSLWYALIAQAALGVTTVLLIFRTLGITDFRRSSMLTGLVLALTQLAWLSSWIMADLFAGLGVLALAALLLWRPVRPGIVDRMIWAFFLAITTFAALSATANILIFSALLVAGLAIRGVVTPTPWFGRADLFPVAAIFLAFVGSMAANVVLFGRAELNAAGPAMIFSRLADVGIAQDDLAIRCHRERLVICAHLPELNRSERGSQTFLWEGLAKKTDVNGTNRVEFSRLNNRILEEHFPRFVLEGMIDTARLFARPTLASDREIVPHVNDDMMGSLRANFPQHVDAAVAARQQSGELHQRFPATFYTFSTYIGYAALVGLTFVAWRNGDRIGTALGLTVLVAIAMQLVLHATLVGPFARYHVKVGWLGLDVALVMWCRLSHYVCTGGGKVP
jgi:hypothetical protein